MQGWRSTWARRAHSHGGRGHRVWVKAKVAGDLRRNGHETVDECGVMTLDCDLCVRSVRCSCRSLPIAHEHDHGSTVHCPAIKYLRGYVLNLIYKVVVEVDALTPSAPGCTIVQWGNARACAPLVGPRRRSPRHRRSGTDIYNLFPGREYHGSTSFPPAVAQNTPKTTVDRSRQQGM